jgi:SAM-dependent methyltransferase
MSEPVRAPIEQGERIHVVDPDDPGDHQEQAFANLYRWAAGQVSGRVAHVACGTGWGTAIIAAGGAQTVGVERDAEALEVARRMVPAGEFIQAEVPPLPLPDDSVEAVVSFETIEHIEDDRGFLAELRRILRPAGPLLLSTPNKERTSPHGEPDNPWHVREYLLGDLLSLLGEAGFPQVEAFCQGIQPDGPLARQAGRLLARFPALCRPGRFWDSLGHGSFAVQRWTGDGLPTGWTLRCR